MRQLAAALVLAAVGLCLLGASQARASCAGEWNAPSQLSTFGARSSVFCLINEERRANGLPDLAANRSLGVAAEHHSRTMNRRNFFGHEPDGSPASRAKRAGYMSGTSWWMVGESLAWGRGSRGTPQGAVGAMMASPMHRGVILNGAFHDLGVGVAMGTPLQQGGANTAIYTLEFGVRR